MLKQMSLPPCLDLQSPLQFQETLHFQSAVLDRITDGLVPSIYNRQPVMLMIIVQDRWENIKHIRRVMAAIFERKYHHESGTENSEGWWLTQWKIVRLWQIMIKASDEGCSREMRGNYSCYAQGYKYDTEHSSKIKGVCDSIHDAGEFLLHACRLKFLAGVCSCTPEVYIARASYSVSVSPAC